MVPFCVPFATPNMGTAMLAMDLVWYIWTLCNIIWMTTTNLVPDLSLWSCIRDGWGQAILFQLLLPQETFVLWIPPATLLKAKLKVSAKLCSLMLLVLEISSLVISGFHLFEEIEDLSFLTRFISRFPSLIASGRQMSAATQSG